MASPSDFDVTIIGPDDAALATPAAGTAHLVEESGGAVVDLVAAYISVWNERNPHTRQSIGADVFTPDAYYADPNTSAQGRSAIDTYVAGWQGQFPDSVFVLGAVRNHHDVAHFGWSFGPADGPSTATGADVVVIERGRISKIYGFFD